MGCAGDVAGAREALGIVPAEPAESTLLFDVPRPSGLGSKTYNEGLSLARANTVRDYLVQAGVPAQTMQVQGKGESEPKVHCAQTRRAELIDCLAPNRRVDIEVFAEK